VVNFKHRPFYLWEMTQVALEYEDWVGYTAGLEILE